MLTLRIRNKLELQSADQELKDYLKSLLTTLNPYWVEAQTFGRYTGNIPKNLYQFSEEGDKLTVPRGMLEHILYDLGREWNVLDERVAPEAEKIWPEGNIILRPNDQEPASLQPHDGLTATCGSCEEPVLV